MPGSCIAALCIFHRPRACTTSCFFVRPLALCTAELGRSLVVSMFTPIAICRSFLPTRPLFAIFTHHIYHRPNTSQSPYVVSFVPSPSTVRMSLPPSELPNLSALNTPSHDSFPPHESFLPGLPSDTPVPPSSPPLDLRDERVYDFQRTVGAALLLASLLLTWSGDQRMDKKLTQTIQRIQQLLFEKRSLSDEISSLQNNHDHFRLPGYRQQHIDLAEYNSHKFQNILTLQADLRAAQDILKDTQTLVEECDRCQRRRIESAGSDGLANTLRSQLQSLVSYLRSTLR